MTKKKSHLQLYQKEHQELIQEVVQLHDENYKIFMKEIKEINKLKDIPCPCIGRFRNAKKSIAPKTIYKISPKTSMQSGRAHKIPNNFKNKKVKLEDHPL